MDYKPNIYLFIYSFESETTETKSDNAENYSVENTSILQEVGEVIESISTSGVFLNLTFPLF